MNRHDIERAVRGAVDRAVELCIAATGQRQAITRYVNRPDIANAALDLLDQQASVQGPPSAETRHSIVRRWASARGVTFVSRSAGTFTTSTLSQDTLEALVEATEVARNAEALADAQGPTLDALIKRLLTAYAPRGETIPLVPYAGTDEQALAQAWATLRDLYAEDATQAPKAVKLTGEQINEIEVASWSGPGFGAKFNRESFARAIEAEVLKANGLGDQQ